MSTERFSVSSIDKIIDIQRRLNEYDALMFQWMQRSSSMSERERAMFIENGQRNYASFVDGLLAELHNEH